jgi:putative PIN family toxin of toxin-antitoxin system
MVKVVPDTNIIISGMLGSQGFPRQLLNLSLAKRVVMYGSEETFNEFCEKIKLPRMEKYLKKQMYTPDKIILDYKSIIKIVEPFEVLDGVQIANWDRDDDIYFRIAKACGAQVVVSGDKKHVLSVKEYDGIVAVPVSKFIGSFSKLKSSKIY